MKRYAIFLILFLSLIAASCGGGGGAGGNTGGDSGGGDPPQGTAGAPILTVSGAAPVAQTGATLHGTVTPNGLETTALFEWGTDPTLAVNSATAEQSMGAGTASLPVSAFLTGLTAGQTYYFRVVASNSAGTVRSDPLSFDIMPVPTFGWETATPESQGMNTAALDSMWSTLEARNTAAFLVIRNDKIVYEKYVSFNRNEKHYTASLAKALVGGVSLMVAMQDGLISPDDLAHRYVPQWTADPVKSTITVRELATHTSGLDDAEEGGLPHESLTGWKGDFWARLPVPDDPFTISRDLAQVIFPPGTASYYSNPGYAMLGYAVTAALEGTPNEDLRSLIADRVMEPIGVPSSEWECGYGDTYTVDGLPLVPTWGGGNYSPDAVARVGRLILRQGDWDGVRIIGSDVVQAATTRFAGLPGDALLGFWGNTAVGGSRPFPSLPEDAVYGAGAGHQVLLIIPSLDVIMVRFGESLDGGEFDPALENYLFAPLMAAF